MLATRYISRLFIPAMGLLLAASTVVSCKKGDNEGTGSDNITMSKHRQRDEERAERYLVRARWAMREGDYAAARGYIEEMRDSCYLALDARERGLLLLDSIELLNAKSDTTLEDHETRVKFYEKKLEYDKKAPRKHDIKK